MKVVDPRDRIDKFVDLSTNLPFFGLSLPAARCSSFSNDFFEIKRVRGSREIRYESLPWLSEISDNSMARHDQAKQQRSRFETLLEGA